MLMDKRFTSTLEVWGGIECSYNRVRSKYFDQLQYSNHYNRTEQDISLFADLGITTMRYPVIWERLQPRMDVSVDWTSVDKGLAALRSRDIKPIAGLMHHGSGTRYADVTSPDFPLYLSKFAKLVAERYPWVEYYTPVNEPLTTARFCGLYGLWHPHKRNDRAFVKILLNELKGIVLSMKEIRSVNPNAKLVQTEDLAKIYSTQFMSYQAKFENSRRWLTFDMLSGKLKPGHPMWNYFRKYVADESELYFFVDNPCSPDIIGLDYYPTSERYLDENLTKYPQHYHGHNHRHHYADVEAVRVPLQEPFGPTVLLNEVWERYHLPMAVTEVHIHCDPDNQIRWFSEIRHACLELIKLGADVRALTTWAMLGSYGWNRLLTSPGGDYEPGAFDLSAGSAVITPLGDYLKKISVDQEFIHPATLGLGWWQHPSRYLYEQLTPEELVQKNQVFQER
jgi:dTDP-4-dehydrorhamnose reductase